ncbi:hypothetical protein LW893_04155 [Parvimonas micra]|uniref:hypothetical protein n=1 Tax=Parvimonas micra TaxID=33033 RepID=UPI001E4CA55F|nr:hypothetical protein [Parvimonas micra]MCE3020130.1 hypothetical protein [Parvimonas micra]
METKKLPKIVFTLSLISFCIIVLSFIVINFTNWVDNLSSIYFYILYITTFILLGLSMYFTRNLSKIYSIISVILFLITFNIKSIMIFILILLNLN